MIEFTENNPSVVGGLDRRIQFTQVKWITLPKFIELLQNDYQIHPFITDSTSEVKSIHKNVYIGKKIPSVDKNNNESLVELNELVGSVRFDYNDQKWKLNLSYDLQVFKVESDFLILNISDPNAFYWARNKVENSFFLFDSRIPKHAYKAALHKVESRYSYIGRVVPETNNQKRPKFYANSWLMVDETVSHTFGRVNETHKLLFTPLRDIEIGHDLFEVLCLKPSPASLKTLCQLKIRECIDYSQEKIKSLYSNSKLLPECLVNYLEYPSFLKSGQYLLMNEKLVDKNGLYELFINQDCNLICRCLKTSKEIIIANDLTTILFHKFQCVFFNHNNLHARIFYVTNSPEYKFMIQWERGGYLFENIF